MRFTNLYIFFDFRALCDGPCSGVSRQVINFKALQLTKFVIKIGPGARTSTVTKVWKKDDISTKWAETSWAKRQVNLSLRANMSDFDRLVAVTLIFMGFALDILGPFPSPSILL